MKKYKITVYHCLTKKKRSFTVDAYGIEGAIRLAMHSEKINHVVDEIIKIELA